MMAIRMVPYSIPQMPKEEKRVRQRLNSIISVHKFYFRITNEASQIKLRLLFIVIAANFHHPTLISRATQYPFHFISALVVSANASQPLKVRVSTETFIINAR